jgi:hypothetical protein
MKNVVFWDMTPRGSCYNRRFEGTYHLYHHGGKNERARNIVSNNEQLSKLSVLVSHEYHIYTRTK